MKRFLSLLIVFVLAFALAVPTYAVNVEGSDYIKFTFDEDIDFALYDGHIFYLDFVFFSNLAGKCYKGDSIIIRDGSLIYNVIASRPISGSGEFTEYLHEQTAYNSSNDIWMYPSVYVHPSILDAENATVYSGLETVGSFESFCNGTSCPATDENIDGICDDCGMALMSLSRTPVPPDVTGNNKNYVMFYSGTVYQYTAYTSDSSYTIRGEEYGARYRTYLEPAVTATRFQSYDGINWDQTYNGTTANDYPGEIGWELISSTYDWYTEEGDRFFPVPLWEEVQMVTQGEMGTLTSETAGTMKTLVVCGVGLMACLMALSLFGKRWLLFLR